jgi:hypothetical protein
MNLIRLHSGYLHHPFLLVFESKEETIRVLEKNIHSNCIHFKNYNGQPVDNLDGFLKTLKDIYENDLNINIQFCRHNEPILIISKEDFFYTINNCQINELWQVMVGEKIGWVSICDYIMFEEVK